MADEARIRQLLEEMLDSERTPEEVCAGDTETLREVRARWERMRRVGRQIDALFPSEHPTRAFMHGSGRRDFELPAVSGYEVQQVIGRGGMGVVFKARHLKLNRTVALKMLLAGAYAGPQELARFCREAEAVAALRHPHIVQVYDAGDVTGRPYFTMEFLEGGSLAQHLAGTALPPRRAAHVVARLACAVQFAHQSGFIHRDLKPGNILLAADGTAKITDFGLVRPIDSGPEFTLSGARIGTPSYMSPEQALGKASAIGPAVDIYALGAVLYEMLTGRPPFHGESAADTERKVIAEEPVPPSRLNAKVPRDLETICLKCLQKEPARRYASAQDLGDDLHRFLDGKPVIARPVGWLERAAKWARRRPALATLGGAVLVCLAVLFAFEIRFRAQENSQRTDQARREERARQAIETAVSDAYTAARAERYPSAQRLLQGAGTHLADANSDDLGLLIDDAKADVRVAERLDVVRTMYTVAKPVSGFFGMMPEPGAFAEAYPKVFAEADFNIDGDAEALAARIRTARLPRQTITALEHWAQSAFLLNRPDLHRKLLRIARLADPEPVWRDRFHDPALWSDEKALRRLAKDSFTVQPAPTPHQLAILGGLLHHAGAKEEEATLLRLAVLQRPGDYVLRWEFANALARNGRYVEAAAHLRVVSGLRPGFSWIENQLGYCLCAAGGADDLQEGIEHLRMAVVYEPTNSIIRYNLALALGRAGLTDAAHEECRQALEANAQDPWAYHALGRLLSSEGQRNEAISMFQKAVEYRPEDKGAHFNLGMTLKDVGRWEEALAEFRRIIELQEGNIAAHQIAGETLLGLRRHAEARAEFERVIHAFDEAKHRSDEDDLDEGTHRSARLGLVEALLKLGQFAAAQNAADLALEVLILDATQRTTLQRQRDIAQKLLPLEGKTAPTLLLQEKSLNFATRRMLAEWFYRYQHATAAAARIYAELLAEQAPPVERLDAAERSQAACAATLAGFGIGDDAAGIREDERNGLRRQALTWWQTARPDFKSGGDPKDVLQAARALLDHEEIKLVRTDMALTFLPDAERTQWQQLWAHITALADLDPAAQVQAARALANRKEWTKAEQLYGGILKNTAMQNGELWFEFAAVQLLAGNREGYRNSCRNMLKTAGQGEMRAYHVARACTLTPGSVENWEAPIQVSTDELQHFKTQFWSLTEQGALLVRSKQSRQAVSPLIQSIKLEPKPGAAVVNWLWLALAYQQLGQEDEARHWLTRATSWLDLLGNEMPSHADSIGLHRHNWLEAHILRQEAERLLPPNAK
jgi:serine/threonine-protein kinase